MLFSSPTFFVFFAAYFAAHLAVPARFRVWLIIAGSTVFYAWWKLDYVWLPYFLMVVAYFGGQWIDATSGPEPKRRRLVAALLLLFTPLVVYKYADFIAVEIIGRIVPVSGKPVGVSLPLGVSFVTFTLTAYLIDVYRKRFPSAKPASVVLAYVLFFPHLIAGPILHPAELIPQLEHPRFAGFKRILVPIAIFSVGLFKKLVIADQVGELVNGVYAQTGMPGAMDAILAMLGFAVQIFCDFSGYTDMAIGLALMIGVKLPNNFERPYTAFSISALWRRWHITLTHFLMHYVYTPLSARAMHSPSYKRYSPLVKILVTVIVPINITFLVSDVWHGAGWNFICFGIVTGIAMTIDALWRWARMPKLYPALAWLLTMAIFLISLVFFRSPTVGKAVTMLAAPFAGGWDDGAASLAKAAFPLVLMAGFAVTHRFDDHRRIKLAVRRLRPEVMWSAVALFWMLAIAVSQGSSGNFVYFDF